MGRRWAAAAMGRRYGRVCGELLDVGARIAVRSYTHCPQTARMYYKPPSTTATGDGSRSAWSAATSSCGEGKAASGAADASMKQQQAAAKVPFDASEFILYGRA